LLTRFFLFLSADCFDSVTCVLFVVSVAEYDQTLREGKENRMLESLALFDDICNSQWFQQTAFILFLNKIDLFSTKIAKIDMKDFCFPTYTGGLDYKAGIEFIRQRFLERNTAPHSIYPHFTQATSTEKIQVVFATVRHTIFSQILEGERPA
jgi:guanine nucleotide-binding protein G(i) subunit alpha